MYVRLSVIFLANHDRLDFPAEIQITFGFVFCMSTLPEVIQSFEILKCTVHEMYSGKTRYYVNEIFHVVQITRFPPTV